METLIIGNTPSVNYFPGLEGLASFIGVYENNGSWYIRINCMTHFYQTVSDSKEELKAVEELYKHNFSYECKVNPGPMYQIAIRLSIVNETNSHAMMMAANCVNELLYIYDFKCGKIKYDDITTLRSAMSDLLSNALNGKETPDAPTD